MAQVRKKVASISENRSGFNEVRNEESFVAGRNWTLLFSLVFD